MSFFMIEEYHLEQLLSSLECDFPLAKCMWQVVKDVLDGRMDAKIFTDQWPNFTTVISQEFTPRVSEVADIRIYTKEKERIMQVLNNANLLEKTGKWQIIYYVTNLTDSGGISSYILKSLQEHSFNVKKTLSCKLFHCPEINNEIPSLSLPPGYMIQDILPEHAEFLAHYCDTAPTSCSMEDKIRYIKEMMSHFDVLGGFTTDNPSMPVSWIYRKRGGIHGMAYTLKEHRQKIINTAIWTHLANKAQSKGEVILFDLDTKENTAREFFKAMGQIHYIEIFQKVKLASTL